VSTPEVKRLEKELAESTDPAERKEIREELKAAKFKAQTKDVKPVGDVDMSSDDLTKWLDNVLQSAKPGNKASIELAWKNVTLIAIRADKLNDRRLLDKCDKAYSKLDGLRKKKATDADMSSDDLAKWLDNVLQSVKPDNKASVELACKNLTFIALRADKLGDRRLRSKCDEAYGKLRPLLGRAKDVKPVGEEETYRVFDSGRVETVRAKDAGFEGTELGRVKAELADAIEGWKVGDISLKKVEALRAKRDALEAKAKDAADLKVGQKVMCAAEHPNAVGRVVRLIGDGATIEWTAPPSKNLPLGKVGTEHWPKSDWGLLQ
jgi:hypothetical protein